VQWPTYNPTLVHHGKAKAATYHVLRKSGGALADLYGVGSIGARAIGEALANYLGETVIVKQQRIGQPLSEHPTRAVLPTRRNPGGPRIVYNKLLGGWYVVVGPHHTPISGRFESKAAAQTWLAMRAAKRNPVAPRVGDRWRRLGGGMVTVKAVTPQRVQLLDTSGNREWVPRTDFAVSYRPNPGRSVAARTRRAAARKIRRTAKRARRRTRVVPGLSRLYPKLAKNPTPTTVREAVAQVLAAAKFPQLVKEVRSGKADPLAALQLARRFMHNEAQRAMIDRAIRLVRHVSKSNPRRVRLDAATRKHLEAWLRSQWPRDYVAARARIYRALRDDPELVDRGRGWSEIERLGEPNPRRARRRLKNPSTLAEAKKTFRRWHAFDAHKVVAVKGPDRVIPKTLVRLGELREVVYSSDKWGGRAKLYVHKTGRPHPILATDPKGRHVHVVGGRMRPTADGLVG
jgi:hypothetical protein